jgi:hypothetical protein
MLLRCKRNKDAAFRQQLAHIDDNKDEDEPISRWTRRKTRALSSSELPRRNLHNNSAPDDKVDTTAMTRFKGGKWIKASNDYAILNTSEEAAVPVGSPSRQDLVQLFSSLKPKEVYSWSKKTPEELAILKEWAESSGGHATTAEKLRIADQLNKPFDLVSKWFRNNKNKFKPKPAASLNSPVSQLTPERHQPVTRRSPEDKQLRRIAGHQSAPHVYLSSPRVVLNPTTVESDYLFNLNPSATNIMESVYSQLTDEENALRPVFNRLMSQQRVGEPMLATQYSSPQAIYPTLKPDMQKIWDVLLDSEQAQRNLPSTPTDHSMLHCSLYYTIRRIA